MIIPFSNLLQVSCVLLVKTNCSKDLLINLERKRYRGVNRDWLMCQGKTLRPEEWITLIGGLYLCQCFNEVVQRQKFHTEWRLVGHRTLRLKRKPLLVLVDYPKPAQTLKKVVITTIAVHIGKLTWANRIQETFSGAAFSHWLTCFL